MLSETLTEIYKRIEDAGASGLMRSQIIKEFGKDAHKRLEELLSYGLICSDKRGNRIIYWSKNNYKANDNTNDKPVEILKSNIEGITNNMDDNVLYNEIIKLSKRVSYIEDLERHVREQDKKINELSITSEKINMQNILNDVNNINQRIDSLNTKFELLNNEHTSLAEKVLLINSRIDELKTDYNTIMHDLNSKLADITDKLDALNKAIEKKVDDTKLSRIEDNLNNNLQKIDTLYKTFENTFGNINERFDNLQKQIGGKADDTKVLDVERRVESLSEMVSKLSEMEKAISKLEMIIKENKEEMEKNITTLRTELQTIHNGNGISHNISLDQFKIEIDRTMTESTGIGGWVELVEIRKKICSKYGISKNTFYSLLSQLIDAYNDRYELSSGGNEGVTIRGLIYGFIKMV